MSYGCYCCSIITSIFSLLIAVAILNLAVMYLIEVASFTQPELKDIKTYCDTQAQGRRLMRRIEPGQEQQQKQNPTTIPPPQEINFCDQQLWFTYLAFAGIAVGGVQIIVAGFLPICIEDSWLVWVIGHGLSLGGSCFILFMFYSQVKDPVTTTYINAPSLNFLPAFTANYKRRGLNVHLAFVAALSTNALYSTLGIVVMCMAFMCGRPSENDIEWG